MSRTIRGPVTAASRCRWRGCCGCTSCSTGSISPIPRPRTRSTTSSRCARGEFAFHVVKRLWGFAKVRYRGLYKNTVRVFAANDLATTGSLLENFSRSSFSRNGVESSRDDMITGTARNSDCRAGNKRSRLVWELLHRASQRPARRAANPWALERLRARPFVCSVLPVCSRVSVSVALPCSGSSASKRPCFIQGRQDLGDCQVKCPRKYSKVSAVPSDIDRRVQTGPRVAQRIERISIKKSR